MPLSLSHTHTRIAYSCHSSEYMVKFCTRTSIQNEMESEQPTAQRFNKEGIIKRQHVLVSGIWTSLVRSRFLFLFLFCISVSLSLSYSFSMLLLFCCVFVFSFRFISFQSVVIFPFAFQYDACYSSEIYDGHVSIIWHKICSLSFSLSLYLNVSLNVSVVCAVSPVASFSF